MGSADIVPGISGGTIALITGIYERLVHSISTINFTFIKPLLKGDLHGFKERLFYEIDFKFANVISYCMDVYTALTYSFFLGLIIASSYVLYRQMDELTLKHLVFTIIGAVLAYIFVSLNPIAMNHTLPILFMSGLIAICAMILPGISGSFLLLLLGQYEYMLNALKTMSLSEIVVFCAGALIGILGFSKILNYLLEHHEGITMAFLIGVMIGTLILPFVNIVNTTPLTFTALLPCIILAVIGFVIIVVMETKFDYIE